MFQLLKKALWGTVDPFVIALARRSEFLNQARPQTQSWPGAVVAPSARIDRKAKLSNLSGRGETITIGARSVVVGELLTLWSGGAIDVGEDSYVGDSSRIWSQSKITIGSRVAISHLVDIHDTDSHPLSPHARHLDSQAILAGKPLIPSGAASAPVVIEDDVWLCFKATVLKGLTIGRGAVVAAGAVVTKDVPPMVVVAGNPARIVAEVPPDGMSGGSAGVSAWR